MDRPNTARRALTLSARAARALALALPVCQSARGTRALPHLPKGNGLDTAADPPLCMIGDSITWADHGDTWRQFLLEQIPTLAFVGSHTAKLGYSHAGEEETARPRSSRRSTPSPIAAITTCISAQTTTIQKDPARVERHRGCTAGGSSLSSTRS